MNQNDSDNDYDDVMAMTLAAAIPELKDNIRFYFIAFNEKDKSYNNKIITYHVSVLLLSVYFDKAVQESSIFCKEKFFYHDINGGVEAIFKGSNFAPGWLGTALHGFQWLDKAMSARKGARCPCPAKTVLCDEATQPTRVTLLAQKNTDLDRNVDKPGAWEQYPSVPWTGIDPGPAYL